VGLLLLRSQDAANKAEEALDRFELAAFARYDVLDPAPDAVIVLDEARIGVEIHDERAMDRKQQCGVRVAARCVHAKASVWRRWSPPSGGDGHLHLEPMVASIWSRWSRRGPAPILRRF
jgi:hypothetical protein